MGGMFPSSQAAKFTFQLPKNPASPYNFERALANILVQITPPLGVSPSNPAYPLNALPSGWTLDSPTSGTNVSSDTFTVVVDPSFWAGYVSGRYHGVCQSNVDNSYSRAWDYCDVGGLADQIELTNIRCEQLEAGNTVFDSVVNTNSTLSPGGTVFQSVEAARVALFNKIEVDATDPANVILILYADDGITPVATRTIANGDGSNVSLAQVLNLGTLQ